MGSENIWEEVLKEAKNHISEQEVNTWLKPIKIGELRGDFIQLIAPNRLYKNWFEEKYLNVVKKIFNETLSIEAQTIQVITKSATKQKKHTAQSVSSSVTIDVYTTNLNKQYTFDNFVVGNSNNFAHAACMAVADGYFHTYNPLFIYGGVGLGKTHLMHAVGNRLLEKFPKLKVLYISSENFTNEMISALKSKKMDEFREKYRKVDVLLFDDVQFLAGKQRSTEEFFYTFNSLYDSQKQIILTSDKTPDEIPEMEERLTTRFAWGLIADIQPPSVEEKTAILMKRAELMNIDLNEKVALFIAENLKSDNIRELIGALIRLSAYSSFNGEPITIELAKKTLDRFLIKKDKIITFDTILKVVTEYFNVKLSELKSKKRTKSIAYPRQIAMYLMREKLNCSLSEIGEIFGGRDHSTVLHSINSIEKKLKKDKELQETIKILEKSLYN